MNENRVVYKKAMLMNVFIFGHLRPVKRRFHSNEPKIEKSTL